MGECLSSWLTLLILLPQYPQCWDYKTPQLVLFSLISCLFGFSLHFLPFLSPGWSWTPEFKWNSAFWVLELQRYATMSRLQRTSIPARQSEVSSLIYLREGEVLHHNEADLVNIWCVLYDGGKEWGPHGLGYVKRVPFSFSKGAVLG